MARRFLREGDALVAQLDAFERQMLALLVSSTRDLLAPDVELSGDPFADLMASLGPMGDDEADEPGHAAETDRTDSGLRDPALARLLPTAHKGDDATAAEFRRLTEQGLRQRKCGNLDVALEALLRDLPPEDDYAHEPATYDAYDADETVEEAPDGDPLDEGGLPIPLRLTEDEAPAVLMALTDVRLLLGERLGLRDDADVERLERQSARMREDDPRLQLLVWYDFITWLQETLASALMGRDEPYAPEE